MKLVKREGVECMRRACVPFLECTHVRQDCLYLEPQTLCPLLATFPSHPPRPVPPLQAVDAKAPSPHPGPSASWRP